MIQPTRKTAKPRLVPVDALLTAVDIRKARLLIASWNRKKVKKSTPSEFLINMSNCAGSTLIEYR